MQMMIERTLDPATDFPAQERYVATVAGLPLRVAVMYVTLFVIAFWAYATLWPSAPMMVTDSASYLRAAQDLSDFRINESHDRAPGYPLLLLLTASSKSPNRALLFLSLSLHFASIWLLAGLLYRAGLSELLLHLFALILLLPPYVEYAGYVLSETLAEAMLVAGLAGFVFWILQKRTMWIVVSALALGYAALTRPVYQIVALAIVGYLLAVTFLFPWIRLKRAEAVKGSIALLCGSIIAVGGYSYLNYRNFGYFGVTTPRLGLTLSTKTVRFVERLPDEYAVTRAALVRARNVALLEADHTGTMYIWSLVPELAAITGLEGPELSGYMLRLNLLLIQKAPLAYLQDAVWAFGSYWFPSSGELANLSSSLLQLVWAVIHFLLIGGFFLSFVLLIGAATHINLVGTFVPAHNLPEKELRMVPLQALMYGFAGTIVFYTAAISCLIEVGDPRYRVPTDALIVFMLFLGTQSWWRLVSLLRTAAR
jgi:hypothetical protein